jgi:hypothetical protein
MPTCTYNNCSKFGIYENFTLCRTHKGYNQNDINNTLFYSSEIPDKNAPHIPIYCKKCNNTTDTLNCKQGNMGLENCKRRTHLCKNCDTCVCGIEDNARQFMYYRECECFQICAGCINTRKCWE